jgi:glutamate formiminotransferase
VLLCVVNVSEGRDADVLAALDDACGPDLLDRHTDPHHHRSVLTLVGEAAVRRLTATAVARLDLARHDGVHPRLGVVDVVPFVPWAEATLADAIGARDRFAVWAAHTLQLPVFLYGPERTLPEVRRHAWRDLVPDHGPARPHPRAGAVCAGARDVLVAYNVWLAQPDLARARDVAAEIRGPELRALGLPVGDRVQVSMNLVAPDVLGPAEAFDLVAARVPVVGAELVGLIPKRVLDAVPAHRWPELDLDEDRTVEARLAAWSARR